MSEPKHYLVDTNILLRFLTGEPPAQAAAVRRLFARAQAGEIVLEVLPMVVSEAYYTLKSIYRFERRVAAETISQLLQRRGIQLREANVLQGTLSRLQNHSIDFADAFLASISEQEGAAIASFDHDFDKLKGITRYEP